MAIEIKLPDGSVRQYEEGNNIGDVASSIFPGCQGDR